jgi:SPP1 family holin
MIKKDTIIRLVVLFLVLVNQILCSYGVISFEVGEDQIYEFVSTLATILISIWTAWKNNSITPEAIKADEYLKQLKRK